MRKALLGGKAAPRLLVIDMLTIHGEVKRLEAEEMAKAQKTMG
mgnify:CR=1 FL=1